MYVLISVYRVGIYYYRYRMAGGIKGHSLKANGAIKALENAGKGLKALGPSATNLMLPKNDSREALLADMEAGRRGTQLAITNGDADEVVDPRELDKAPARK